MGAFLVTLSVTVSLYAQSSPGPIAGPTVLVPLFRQMLPGANGSIWSSELTIYNGGVREAEVVWSCVSSACAYFPVAPGRIAQPPGFLNDPFPGLFLGFFTDSDDVSFNLRVRNTSDPTDQGTHVPVVRWDLLRSDNASFINVSNREGVRHTLRIYTARGDESMVVVRYFDAASGLPLFELEPLFVEGARNAGYAQVDSALLPTLHSSQLRVEVQNLFGVGRSGR